MLARRVLLVCVCLWGMTAGGTTHGDAPTVTPAKGSASAAAAVPTTTTAATPPGIGAKTSAIRLREGTELHDAIGTFQFSSDRATFKLPRDGGMAEFITLENLNLERINQTTQDVGSLVGGPSLAQWKVSGVTTEFNGKNYLLISKAVLLSKPPETGTPLRPTRPEAAKNPAPQP